MEDEADILLTEIEERREREEKAHFLSLRDDFISFIYKQLIGKEVNDEEVYAYTEVEKMQNFPDFLDEKNYFSHFIKEYINVVRYDHIETLLDIYFKVKSSTTDFLFIFLKLNLNCQHKDIYDIDISNWNYEEISIYSDYIYKNKMKEIFKFCNKRKILFNLLNRDIDLGKKPKSRRECIITTLIINIKYLEDKQELELLNLFIEKGYECYSDEWLLDFLSIYKNDDNVVKTWTLMLIHYKLMSKLDMEIFLSWVKKYITKIDIDDKIISNFTNLVNNLKLSGIDKNYATLQKLYVIFDRKLNKEKVKNLLHCMNERFKQLHENWVAFS
jgi:hypothetical protein